MRFENGSLSTKNKFDLFYKLLYIYALKLNFMEQEKELNLDDSLKIIRQMVNAGETRLNDRGIHFIVWGVMIALASLIHALFSKHFSEDGLFVLWTGAFLLSAMISIVYEVKYFRPYINESMMDKIFFRIILAFIFLLINTATKIGRASCRERV